MKYFLKAKTRAKKKLLLAGYRLALVKYLIHMNFALKEYM